MRRLGFVFCLVFVSVFASSAGAAPAMWKVHDKDTTIHIFGTIHVLKPGTVWLNDKIQNSLSHADKIFLEISAEEQQNTQLQLGLVQKYGMLTPPDTIEQHLPKETADKFMAQMLALGAQKAGVERLKPWMAGVTYETLRFIRLGYKPAAGVEATVGGLAQAKGIPLAGLETTEYQIKLLSSMSDKDAALMIDNLLDDANDLPGLLEKITVSWTSGDLKTLDDVLNKDDETSPELAEKLLYDRNKLWVQKVQDILKMKGDYVIAVGSAHLVGDRSLIALLKKAGMKVMREQ